MLRTETHRRPPSHLPLHAVRHQPDAAKQFYTEVLGFEERADVHLGDGFRWVTIGHPDQPELQVTVMLPGPPLVDFVQPPSEGRTASRQ